MRRPAMSLGRVLMGLLTSSLLGGTALAGKPCASGCAAAGHDAEPVEDSELRRWLERFASEPLGEATEATDSLLFHGRRVRSYLDVNGSRLFDAAHRDFLERELGRTRALVEVRLVDDTGVVRATLHPTSVGLGERTHVEVDDVHQLQRFAYSGTVVRVGLRHLWARL